MHKGDKCASVGQEPSGSKSGSVLQNDGTSKGPVRPIVLPDTFTGEEEEFIDLLESFEACAAVNKWTDEEKCQFVAIKLKGSARKVFNDIEPGAKREWILLEDELKRRLDGTRRPDLYKSEFLTRIKKSDEGYLDFSNALRILARKEYPIVSVGIRDELARDQFLRGLGGVDISLKVRHMNPATLDDAVRMSIEWEAVERDVRNQSANKPTPVVSDLTGAVGGQTASKTDELISLMTKLLSGMSSISSAGATSGRERTKRALFTQSLFWKEMSDDSLRSSLMIRNDKSEANSDFVRDENVVAEIGSENKSDATQNCPKHKASKTTNNKVRTRDRISNLESKLDKFLEVFDQRTFIAPTFGAAFEKHRKIDKSQRFDQTRPIRDKSQRLDNYNNAYQDEASAKRAKFKNYKSIISSNEDDDVLSLQPGQSEINCFSSDYAQSDENNCMPVLEKEVVPSTEESNVNVTDKSLFDIFGKDALNHFSALFGQPYKMVEKIAYRGHQAAAMGINIQLFIQKALESLMEGLSTGSDSKEQSVEKVQNIFAMTTKSLDQLGRVGAFHHIIRRTVAMSDSALYELDVARRLSNLPLSEEGVFGPGLETTLKVRKEQKRTMQDLLTDFQARKRKSSVVQQPEPFKRGRLSYKPYKPANYNTSSNYSFRAKRFTERYQDKKPYTRGYDRKPNFKSGKAYRPNKKSNE
ncbi:hypothetical protein LOTGIDRAFT_164300 [Lottia gigantea]|uniref:Retrotransposon gag domain-containing protein n=1 Tax=Lottia gigantea TaxID=225164 RepID=V3ZGP0_LOTGI|nr:hypothetical protein LOTGIDRAFT_164300 [Lottia gigantea]ESO90373.1 hypothetical protein LOTGIDRAFT_164300 [Lottia gigantea]